MRTSPRSVAVAAIAALGIASLAACGTQTLEGPEVASQVESKVLAKRGIEGAKVSCPAETEAEKGTTIKCSVSDADKHKGTVTASVVDEEGTLGDFEAKVDALQMAVIEKNAQRTGRSDGVAGEVDCPDGTEPKKGATFFCTANIRRSGFGVVIVSQKDEASNVSVDVQRRKLRTAEIERDISKEVRKQGINADVNCPARVTSQKGSRFNCTVRNPANGRQLTVQATQTDEHGNFSLKVK